MKNNIFLFGTLLLFAISLASCKKDYNCECIVSGEGVLVQFTNVRKVKAEEMCNDVAIAQGVDVRKCSIVEN